MAQDRAPVSILPMALLCPLDEVKILKQSLSQPPASTLAITRLQGLVPVLVPVFGTGSLSSPHTVSLGKWKRLPRPVHLRNQATFSFHKYKLEKVPLLGSHGPLLSIPPSRQAVILLS